MSYGSFLSTYYFTMIKPEYQYEILNINTSSGFAPEYSVTFRITDTCDLKCSYCHWHSGPQYEYDDIIVSIDRLFEFFQKQKFKSVLFYYHGGEPTRHKRVLDILKYIKQKSNETGIAAYNEMQTNLTLGAALLEEILPYCDMLDITLHYHELKTRGKGFKLEDFNRNYQYLIANNIRIHNMDIMLEDIPIDWLSEFYRAVEEYLAYDNIENSEMIYGYYRYDSNTETAKKHLEFYQKANRSEQSYLIDGTVYHTNELFIAGVDCTGWKCEVGKQSLYVNGTGDAFVCGEHTTQYAMGYGAPYTNLLTDNAWLAKLVILTHTGTVCRWTTCGGDYYTPRKK